MSVPLSPAATPRTLSIATLVVSVTSLVVLVWGAGSAEAQRTPWQHTLGASHIPTAVHFSEPSPESADPAAQQDKTVLEEAKRLIDSARGNTSPTGAPQTPDWVVLAIHSITWKPLAESMVNAARRGVNILAVGQESKRYGTSDPDPADSDPNDRRWAAVKYLDDYFTTADGTPLMHWCPSPGGCISNSSDGDMHAKFITLQSAEDPSGVRRTNVSWISSANFTGNTGYEKWNNSLTTYGDSALMNKLNEIFWAMWYQSPRTTNYYNPSLSPPRGYVVAPSGTLHASPEQETDLVAKALSNISVPSGSTGCRVRVVHTQFSYRFQVVDQLRRLKKANCIVEIVANRISESMYDALRSGTRTGEAIPADRIHETRYSELHDKYIVFYAGDGSTYRVLTGSHNLTQDANYENDEVLFRTATGRAVHDQYYFHFSRILARSRAWDAN